MAILGSMMWVTLPFVDEPLDSAFFLGNGKDSEIHLSFANGQQIALEVSGVRAEIDGRIDVDVSSVGDLSLRIDYVARGLYLRSGRLGWPDANGEGAAQFRDDVQSWFADGCAGFLRWVAQVEFHLGSR